MGILGTNFWEGDMKIVDIAVAGTSLGKTTGGCSIQRTVNYKEIMKDQNGSVPYDKIRTGVGYQMKAIFSDLSISLYTKLCKDLTTTGLLKSVKGGRKIFSSLRAEAQYLDVTKYEDDGVTLSTDPDQKMHVYLATAEITGDFDQSGPDNQRTLEVTFDFWFDYTKKGYFYTGTESSVA